MANVESELALPPPKKKKTKTKTKTKAETAKATPLMESVVSGPLGKNWERKKAEDMRAVSKKGTVVSSFW